MIKLNSDALKSEAGWIGVGVVARDSNGKVLFAATRRVRAWWPVEIAEGKALMMAIKLSYQHGFEDRIVESDS